MKKYGNYDIDLTLSWTDSGVQISSYHCQHWFRWRIFPVRYKAITCIENRLVPLDTLGTGLSVNIVYCTRTSGVLFGTISIGIDIQYFQLIKSISKWRLLNGSHIFQASIWLFENVPRSFNTLGTEASVNNVYKNDVFVQNIREYI